MMPRLPSVEPSWIDDKLQVPVGLAKDALDGLCENVGVLHQGPGNGQALLLAIGEVGPPFADLACIPGGQSHEVRVNFRHPGCPADIRL